MRSGLSVLAVCLTLLIVISCRGGGQVYQVKDAPVQTASGKDLSMDQVRKEIVAAGIAAGWQMVATKPGEIVHIFVNLLIFCSINTIRGTKKRILKTVCGFRSAIREAIFLAHSKAISVFPVPVL